MGFNLNAAREQFTDEEIARKLSSVHGFDMDGAIASDPKKFTPSFIAEKLSTLPTPDSLTAPQEPPVPPPGVSFLSVPEPEVSIRPDKPTLPNIPLSNEEEFQRQFISRATRIGRNPDPDDPRHFYNARAAFDAGVDIEGADHLPSEFKKPGHPSEFKSIKDNSDASYADLFHTDPSEFVSTITGETATREQFDEAFRGRLPFIIEDFLDKVITDPQGLPRPRTIEEGLKRFTDRDIDQIATDASNIAARAAFPLFVYGIGSTAVGTFNVLRSPFRELSPTAKFSEKFGRAVVESGRKMFRLRMSRPAEKILTDLANDKITRAEAARLGGKLKEAGDRRLFDKLVEQSKGPQPEPGQFLNAGDTGVVKGAGFQPPATVQDIKPPPPVKIDPIPPAVTMPVTPEPVATLPGEPKPVKIRAKKIKVPGKPKKTFNPDTDTLIDFVRKRGGLSTGGSLRGELIDKFSIKEGFGLLNNKTGLTPDRMREAAQEAGFLGLETDSDLLRKLESDVFAKKNKLTNSRIFHPNKTFTDDELIKAEDDFYEGLAGSVDNPIEDNLLSGDGIFADLSAPGAKKPPRMTQAGMVSAKNRGITPRWLELPEMVELAERVSGGKIPRVKKELRKFGGQARGQFNSKTGEITFRADIFEDIEQATSTVAHEIGHMVDWLPEEDIARGNILGRIASLKKFMKGNFQTLASNQVIRDQLKALSLQWRPLPQNPSRALLQNRNSSAELYGDAISVLLNDPVRLRVDAPDFYDGFFEFLDKKPEVRATYDDIQNRINSGTVMDDRVERLRDSFVEADKLYDKELQEPKWLDQLKTAFVDVNHTIIKEVKNAGESNVPAGENPRYKLEEMAYTGAEVEAYLSGFSNRVLKPLKAAGLDLLDLGEYQFQRRVASERSEIANPLGWNKKNSIERLFEMREQMTPDQFRVLEGSAAAFWDNRNEMLVSKILDSGIFSPELNAKIADNVNYVTFDVAKFMEQQHGRTAGAKIYKQVGTLQKITNPLTATLLKDTSLIASINRNIAAESVVSFLQKFSPDQIRDADRIKGFFQKPKDPKEGLILFQKGGDLQGFYVNKFISDSFDINPYEGNFIGKTLRATAVPFRTIFTEINPGFWMFNIHRDFFRAATNLPKANIVKFLPEYIGGIKPAFRSAFGIPDGVVNDMLKGKMLISIADFRNASSEDVQVEKLLKRFSIVPKTWDNKVIRPFGKVFHFMQNVGRGIERTTKVASFNYLKKHYPDLTQEEIGHIVRTQGGSPDFMRLGTQYPIYNNALLFTNAMKEGYRGDYEAMANNPTEFWWKKTKYSIIPKLLMFAAGLGMLGDDNKEIMDKTSEYDKSNYHIIPFGLTPSGKAVIMRVPVDEGARLIGGITWKSLNLNKAGQIQNMFDYMAGQAPTLNPAIDAVVAAVQYASGRNPYDAFRGRYAIPETVFEAGGQRAHIAFAKWLANKSGGSIVYRFNTNNAEKIKTELEEVLGLPLVNNIVGRFIKVTDQGLREQLREAKQEVRVQNAEDILLAREALAKIVNNEDLNDDDILALATKPDIMDRNILTMLSRRHGWVFAEALLTARSVAERVAVLEKMESLEKRKEPKENQ